MFLFILNEFACVPINEIINTNAQIRVFFVNLIIVKNYFLYLVIYEICYFQLIYHFAILFSFCFLSILFILYYLRFEWSYLKILCCFYTRFLTQYSTKYFMKYIHETINFPSQKMTLQISCFFMNFFIYHTNHFNKSHLLHFNILTNHIKWLHEYFKNNFLMKNLKYSKKNTTITIIYSFIIVSTDKFIF